MGKLKKKCNVKVVVVVERGKGGERGKGEGVISHLQACGGCESGPDGDKPSVQPSRTCIGYGRR